MTKLTLLFSVHFASGLTDPSSETLRLSVFERWNNCAGHITMSSVDAFPHETTEGTYYGHLLNQ